MQNSKKATAVVLIAVLLIIVSSSMYGCVNHEEEVVIGDFICQTWESNNTIHLKDLSEEGKKKKYIVVPEELNGMRVDMLGYRNAVFSRGRSNWHSENLEKLYVNNKYVLALENVFEECAKIQKCFLINNEFEDQSMFVGLVQFYMSSYRYYNFWGGDSGLPMKLITGSVANISYFYNYEDSPNNGYYWIDDVEDGELIEFIPEEPTREGYKFGGWYKEQECINEWDFENDRVVKAQIHLEGVEKFIENKLFAQWVKE